MNDTLIVLSVDMTNVKMNHYDTLFCPPSPPLWLIYYDLLQYFSISIKYIGERIKLDGLHQLHYLKKYTLILLHPITPLIQYNYTHPIIITVYIS